MMLLASIAPGWRATSRPPRNRAKVGMLRILKRAPRSCEASVLTLTTRKSGSSDLAACAYQGAIVRQGPHQGAQKSTSTGMSVRSICLRKRALARSTGWPVNKSFWHLPQVGCSIRRAAGKRLTASQWGHTMCRESGVVGVMAFLERVAYGCRTFYGVSCGGAYLPGPL